MIQAARRRARRRDIPERPQLSPPARTRSNGGYADTPAGRRRRRFTTSQLERSRGFGSAPPPPNPQLNQVPIPVQPAGDARTSGIRCSWAIRFLLAARGRSQPPATTSGRSRINSGSCGRPTNSVVSAEITDQTATSQTAKAGVMMRAGTGEGAADYAVLVTAGQGVYVESRYANAPRRSDRAPAGAVPTFVRIVRFGTTFSAQTSGDGVTWTPVAGSTVMMPNLSGTLLGGLALCLNDSEKLASANFTSATISGQ